MNIDRPIRCIVYGNCHGGLDKLKTLMDISLRESANIIVHFASQTTYCAIVTWYSKIQCNTIVGYSTTR